MGKVSCWLRLKEEKGFSPSSLGEIDRYFSMVARHYRMVHTAVHGRTVVLAAKIGLPTQSFLLGFSESANLPF